MASKFSPILQFQIPYFFQGWKRKLLGGGPAYITFFVNNVCNANCLHCLVPGKPKEPISILQPEETEKIARSMAPFSNLLIMGGEPFLRGDLPELLYPFYKHCGVRQISIPTNGSLPDKCETISQRLAVLCPGAKINIRPSVDGPPELHNKIRGISDGFNLSMETIKRLETLEKSLPNLFLELDMTMSTLNHNAYDSILAELDKRGIRQTPYIVLTRFPSREPDLWKVPSDSYQKAQNSYYNRGLRMSGKEHPQFFQRVIMAYINRTGKRIHRIHTDPSFKWKCTAGRLSAVIDETGNVYPCEVLWHKIGNLRQVDYDMQKIMNGPESLKFREGIRDGCRCTHETNVTLDVSFSLPSLSNFTKDILFPSTKNNPIKPAGDTEGSIVEDGISHEFYFKVRPTQHRRVEEWIMSILPSIKQAVKDQGHLLEIGVGTGMALKYLAKNLPESVKITGIDSDPRMIEFTCSELTEHTNVDLKMQDGRKLTSFPDGSFNVVYCEDSFHHIDPIDSVIEESARVLDDNGLLIMMDMNPEAPINKIFCFGYPLLRLAGIKWNLGEAMYSSLKRAPSVPMIVRHFP